MKTYLDGVAAAAKLAAKTDHVDCSSAYETSRSIWEYWLRSGGSPWSKKNLSPLEQIHENNRVIIALSAYIDRASTRIELFDIEQHASSNDVVLRALSPKLAAAKRKLIPTK